VKTNVYVDAFNLYYGCLKQTGYRWLDLGALAHSLLPQHQVNRLRYFTALVNTIPGDGDGAQPLRQALYLRALRTLPNLSIHLGHYLSHPTTMPLATPPPNAPRFASVVKTEEKGSDVNLATMLLLDAFRGDFEQALVVTNDSDLAMPIQVVRDCLRLPVGVAYPCCRPGRRPSTKLRQVASFTRDVRESALKRCQFPSTLSDAKGTFTKPVKW
jgi:hypothetical protein